MSRLFSEKLFENQFVTGYAINTDAQALLTSPIEQKILIGRTARGRGAGGDPTKGEAAALESENILKKITDDTQLAIITAGMEEDLVLVRQDKLLDLLKTKALLPLP